MTRPFSCEVCHALAEDVLWLLGEDLIISVHVDVIPSKKSGAWMYPVDPPSRGFVISSVPLRAFLCFHSARSWSASAGSFRSWKAKGNGVVAKRKAGPGSGRASGRVSVAGGRGGTDAPSLGDGEVGGRSGPVRSMEKCGRVVFARHDFWGRPIHL